MIRDFNHHSAILFFKRNLRATAISLRVFYQVSQRASKRERPHRNSQIRPRRKRKLRRHDLVHTGQDLADLDPLGGLRGADAAGIGQGRIQHALHFLDAGDQMVAGFLIVDHFRVHPERRQRRAQVVTNSRKHAGAVLDKPGQAFLHDSEGGGQIAHLGRAGRLHGSHVFATAEPFAGHGQIAQGAGNACHQEPETGRQQTGRREHKGQGRAPGPLQRRALEPGLDIQPLPPRQRNGHAHFQGRHIAPGHVGMHIGHFRGKMRQRQDGAFDLVHIDPDLAPERIFQKRPDPFLHGA